MKILPPRCLVVTIAAVSAELINGNDYIDQKNLDVNIDFLDLGFVLLDETN
jgi:hypothetical protein